MFIVTYTTFFNSLYQDDAVFFTPLEVPKKTIAVAAATTAVVAAARTRTAVVTIATTAAVAMHWFSNISKEALAINCLSSVKENGKNG